jgi:ketosteroid isomerase-like protein
MTFTIDGAPVEAPDATTALRSLLAKTAKKGSEFRDARGTLLAVYRRIEIDGDWLLAWQRTDAWVAGGH